MHAVHESVAASLSDSEETHSREKDVQPPVESVLCEKALMLLFNLLSWLLAAPPDAAPASVSVVSVFVHRTEACEQVIYFEIYVCMCEQPTAY